jgi:hypothetical protein
MKELARFGCSPPAHKRTSDTVRVVNDEASVRISMHVQHDTLAECFKASD